MLLIATQAFKLFSDLFDSSLTHSHSSANVYITDFRFSQCLSLFSSFFSFLFSALSFHLRNKLVLLVLLSRVVWKPHKIQNPHHFELSTCFDSFNLFCVAGFYFCFAFGFSLDTFTWQPILALLYINGSRHRTLN